MTQAVTSFEAFGIEIDEPLTKRFRQVVKLNVSGASTDTIYDLGTNTGTFWTAAGGSVPGAAALACLKNVQTIASTFLNVQSTNLMTRSLAKEVIRTFLSAASTGGAAAEAYTVTGLKSAAHGDTILSVVPVIASATGRPSIIALTSSVYAGGSATPTLAVTGLLTTDTILGAYQQVKNANSLPLIGAAATCGTNDQFAVVYSADPGGSGTVRVVVSRVATTDTYVPVSYGTQIDDGLTVTYGANPGAGAKVEVTVLRAAAVTPDAGQYLLTVSNLRPQITFASGDAPTTMTLWMEWDLQDDQRPVKTSG